MPHYDYLIVGAGLYGAVCARLWRAPPLEMRRERQEFFPYETGKGSLISS